VVLEPTSATINSAFASRGFEADCLHLKVPDILGLALWAALRKAIAMEFRQLVTRHSRAEVQAVYVLADYVLQFASAHQRDKGLVRETGLGHGETDLGTRQWLPLALQGPNALGTAEIRDARRRADARARECHDSFGISNLHGKKYCWMDEKGTRKEASQKKSHKLPAQTNPKPSKEA
jgi:hypothetical protein